MPKRPAAWLALLRHPLPDAESDGEEVSFDLQSKSCNYLANSPRCDARRFDDRPPLLYFGFLQCAERLWEPLVGWWNRLTLVGIALLNRSVSQGRLYRVIQSCNDQL